MNDDFRTRAFLPMAVPLGILAVVGLGMGLYWFLLSWNTREGAAAVAIVAAAGILVAIALATSQDTLSRAKKAGVAMAAIGPIAVAGFISLDAFNGSPALGIDESVLNINAVPEAPSLLLAAVDDEAPLLAAEDLTSFCLPSGGGCEPTNEWAIEAGEDFAELFTYTFDNQHAGVEHNLALYDLPEEGAFGSGVDQLGTEPLTPAIPEVFAGVETRSYEFEWGGEEGEGEPVNEFYFVCTVHPSTMWGVATVDGGV